MAAGLRAIYVNDAQGLLYGCLRVERETRVNLCGDLAGDDLEDLLAELHEQVVQCGIDLVVDVAATVGFAVLDGIIDELRILLLLGGGEDQRGVGGGVLGVVLGNGREIARVADDDLFTSC